MPLCSSTSSTGISCKAALVNGEQSSPTNRLDTPPLIFWIPGARFNRGYRDPNFASPPPLVSWTSCEKPHYNISTVASRPSHHGGPFLPDVWLTPGEHVVRVNKIPKVDRNVSDGVDLTGDTSRA